MWGADATQLQMGSGQPFTIKSFFFIIYFKKHPSPTPEIGKVSSMEEHSKGTKH